jgi:hypothetical protein
MAKYFSRSIKEIPEEERKQMLEENADKFT